MRWRQRKLLIYFSTKLKSQMLRSHFRCSGCHFSVRLSSPGHRESSGWVIINQYCPGQYWGAPGVIAILNFPKNKIVFQATNMVAASVLKNEVDELKQTKVEGLAEDPEMRFLYRVFVWFDTLSVCMYDCSHNWKSLGTTWPWGSWRNRLKRWDRSMFALEQC